MKKIIILLFAITQVALAQAPKKLSVIFEVAGQDSGALLGSYVKGVGDLNKDGYDDVAVSAPGKLQTYIYYGGQTMSQQPSLTFEGGGTIISGDFNGDTWIDLAIEKYFRDTVFIYFGGFEIDSIPDKTLFGENSGDGFGYENLAAGDLNGDGIDDLIIGASQFPSINYEYKGKVYIYTGGEQINSIPTRTFIGDSANSRLGLHLAIGNVNDDGKKDIVAIGWIPVSGQPYYALSIYLGEINFQLKRDYFIDSRNTRGGFKHNVACFDADGDSIDDILVNKVFIFKGGTQLDTVPTYYIPPPNNDTTNFGSYP